MTRKPTWILASILCAGTSVAAPPGLQSGDLLIANHEVIVHGHAGVVRVDPLTGKQQVLVMGGLIGQPNVAVANAARNTLYIADSSAQGSGAILAVNIANGAQRVVTSGGLLGCPEGLAIEPTGQLLVTYGCLFPSPGIVRADPANGAQSDLCDVENAGRLTVDLTGQIFLTVNGPTSPDVRISRIDPVTGAETVVSSVGLLTDPRDIGVAANGDIFVLNRVQGVESEILRIDPVTGAQSIVSSGNLLTGAMGLAVASNGDIYVVNPGQPSGPQPADGMVFRVDPVTGVQTIVSQGKKLLDPLGVWVVP